MFPFHDENKTLPPAYLTIVLIAINVLVWLFVEGAGSAIPLARAVCDLGRIPGELTGMLPPGPRFPLGGGLVCQTDPGRQVSNVITSMFLHGSWMHLIGNMWFLWLFGNNGEDSMGHLRYVIFYLLCGIGAALAQVAANPASGIPMVGASGAISGVMGAYLVLFPRVRVYTMVPLGFFLHRMALPAWAMLIYWAFLQFAGGLTSIASERAGGVAFWAHVGGFVAGLILVKVFERRDRVAAHSSHHYRPRDAG